MDLKKALKLTNEFLKNPPTDKVYEKCKGYYHFEYFTARLYAKGYMIISPEELKKINGMTVLADMHGMNPFKPE